MCRTVHIHRYIYWYINQFESMILTVLRYNRARCTRSAGLISLIRLGARRGGQQGRHRGHPLQCHLAVGVAA